VARFRRAGPLDAAVHFANHSITLAWFSLGRSLLGCQCATASWSLLQIIARRVGCFPVEYLRDVPLSDLPGGASGGLPVWSAPADNADRMLYHGRRGEVHNIPLECGVLSGESPRLPGLVFMGIAGGTVLSNLLRLPGGPQVLARGPGWARVFERPHLVPDGAVLYVSARERAGGGGIPVYHVRAASCSWASSTVWAPSPGVRTASR